MKPRVPITDAAFRYVPAALTDIRQTFAKARRRIVQEQKDEAEAKVKTIPLKRRAT